MYKLVTKKYFDKKLGKQIKNNLELKKSVKKCFELLISNPKNIILKSHKVNSRHFDNVFSSSVTGDIRIIWKYGELEEATNEEMEIQILELLDIGGHGGNTGVY